MANNDQRPSTERKYPELYEKLIPVALVVIIVAIVVLFFVAIAVALGLFPGK